MFTLTCISPYTIYEAGSYLSIDLCEQECERRFRVKGLKFKLDEDGRDWRAVVPSEEGVIVLKLTEVKDASVDS